MSESPPTERDRRAKMPSTIPLVCFVGALAADLTYWNTTEAMWSVFSAWLTTAGLDRPRRHTRRRAVSDLFIAGASSARVGLPRRTFGRDDLAVIDVLVHSRDGYTPSFPQRASICGRSSRYCF